MYNRPVLSAAPCTSGNVNRDSAQPPLVLAECRNRGSFPRCVRRCSISKRRESGPAGRSRFFLTVAAAPRRTRAERCLSGSAVPWLAASAAGRRGFDSWASVSVLRFDVAMCVYSRVIRLPGRTRSVNPLALVGVRWTPKNCLNEPPFSELEGKDWAPNSCAILKSRHKWFLPIIPLT